MPTGLAVGDDTVRSAAACAATSGGVGTWGAPLDQMNVRPELFIGG
jgi:hypothetical protein